MSTIRVLIAALAVAGLGLSACGKQPAAAPAAPAEQATEAVNPPPEIGTLEWAASGPWRLDPERDRWRHPIETLKFYGLASGMTVVEIYPGRGWYTSLLAPYLAKNGGRLIGATFDPATATEAQKQTLDEFTATFVGKPETFGDVSVTTLSATSPGIGPAESADLVIVSRNVHTLLGERFAEKAFADFYKVLKPGGVLGIEQHRARSTGLQDPQASNGYVQEAFVKMLATEAGFEFVGSSEINANPRDDRDHPFGVWTLPPTLRTGPIGGSPDPRFDTSPYRAIGESDRMTLKFRKPGGPAAGDGGAAGVVPATPALKGTTK